MIRLLSSILLLIISGCVAQTKENRVGYFEWSSNKEGLVFSYHRNGLSAIYLSDSTGQNVTALAKSSSYDTIFLKPRFSDSGNEVLFLKHSKESKLSHIISVDLLSNKISRVTTKPAYIIDMVYSKNKDIVYFVGTFENTLESSVPKGVDIYKLNTNKIKRITNLDAYSIRNLVTFEKDGVENLAFIMNSNIVFGFDPMNASELFDLTPQIESKPNQLKLASSSKPFIGGFELLKDDSIMRFSTSYLIYDIQLDSIGHMNAKEIARPANSTLSCISSNDKKDITYFTHSSSSGPQLLYYEDKRPDIVKPFRLVLHK